MLRFVFCSESLVVGWLLDSNEHISDSVQVPKPLLKLSRVDMDDGIWALCKEKPRVNKPCLRNVLVGLERIRPSVRYPI